MGAGRLQNLPVIPLLVVCRPCGDGSLLERQLGIGDYHLGVNDPFDPQPLAIGAGSVGGVKAKTAWLNFGDAGAVVGAVEVFGVEQIHGRFGVGHIVNDDDATPQHQRGFDRVGQAGASRRALFLALGRVLNHQPIHHRLDGVVFVPVKLNLLLHLVQLPIDPHPYKTRLAHILEHPLVVALPLFNQGSQNLDARAVGQRLHLFDDLLGRLRPYGTAALRAVRRARPRIEQAQIVVHLGHRAHRGAGIVTDPFLVNGNGRA